MRKLGLTFPDEIRQELQLLCLNQPKKCRKQSKMGWTTNDRIIILNNNYLQYYTLHPGFVQNKPQTIKKKYFKAAVKLDLIHEINYLPKNKIKKTFIQIVFPQDKKIDKLVLDNQQNQNDQQIQNIKQTSQQKLQRWLFEFDIDIKQYVQQKKQQKRQIQRALTKIEPPSPKSLSRSNSAKSISSPRILKSQDKHEQNIQKYVQSIKKTKQYLQNKAQMAMQQALRQKKKKQKQLAQMNSSKNQQVQQSFSLSSFWRQYFKSFQLVVKKDKQKVKQQVIIQRQIQLIRQVQYFNNVAVKLVQNYIQDILIGWSSSKREFQGFKYYQGLWLKIGGKQLNQAFLANYYLNDIFYSMKDVKGLNIRVPLMSLIKYKGFKVLVMCDMPFSQLQKSQVYSLTQQGYDLLLMGKLKDSLQIVEDILNIKSQPIQNGKTRLPAPFGINLKIFQYNYKRDKSQDQITLPHFYYLINPGAIFPLDFNFQRDQMDINARLRPELVAFFRDVYKDKNSQLLSQAFMKSTMSEQYKKNEDQKVIQASKILQKFKINNLIHQLDNLKAMLIDSYSIKKTLQQQGINIRYIGTIYNYCNLPYIRDIIEVQALARTIKKQFRITLRDIQKNTSYINYNNIKDQKDRFNQIKREKSQSQKKYRQMAADFLNLIFGVGQQTKQFWNIIIKKCNEYYKIKCNFPIVYKPIMLLNAILWNCQLKLNTDVSFLDYFVSNQIFHESNIQFNIKVKTFDYPSFQIHRFFRTAPSLQDKISFQLFVQSSKKLLKYQMYFNNQLYGQTGSSFLSQISLSKMSNFSNFIQKPTAQTNIHPILIPFYLKNKSQHNYHECLKLLTLTLPNTHPLFVSFYIQYSEIMQTQLLRKTALLAAVKSFGQFHEKTIELYSKFSLDGQNEYKLKAMRVKSLQSCAEIADTMFKQQKYESCLKYCLDQIQKINNDGNQKLGTGNYKIYMKILTQGLQSAIQVSALQQGIKISEQLSEVISSFKVNDSNFTYLLFKQVWIIHLLNNNKKYFIYKIVLLTIYIREKYQKIQKINQVALPCGQRQKQLILQGLATQYLNFKNHSQWVGYILNVINRSFKYFNFLQDLFNNYKYHLQHYQSQQFNQCLGYIDIFVRLYGQKIFKQCLYDVRFK